MPRPNCKVGERLSDADIVTGVVALTSSRKEFAFINNPAPIEDEIGVLAII